MSLLSQFSDSLLLFQSLGQLLRSLHRLEQLIRLQSHHFLSMLKRTKLLNTIIKHVQTWLLSLSNNNFLSPYCMPALFKKLSRAANRTKFLPFWSSCFSIFFYSYIRPQTQKLFHPLKIILIKFPKLLKPMVNSIILLRCKKTREARKFEFLHVTKKSQTFWPTH